MNQFKEYENSERSMELLNRKQSLVHRMNPFVKIIVTLLYLVLLLSYSQYDLDGILIFCAYPIFVVLIADIPIKDVGRKIAFTLPFILFIGITNLIINKTPLLTVGEIVVTKGMVSFLAILLKAVLSVTALYLLTATTESTKLMTGFRMLHIPDIFLLLFELMIRYIGVLVEEAKNMYYAYRLRAPGSKGILIRHMGEFIGQLLIKSIDRAERIYHAMKCRGYGGTLSVFHREKLKGRDYLQLFVIIVIMILSRLIKVG